MERTTQKTYLQTKDFLVSQESFSLVWDEKYKMLITLPQPRNLSKYYKTQAYISHTDSQKGLLNFIYQLVKKWSLRNKRKLIEVHQNTKGSVLDIGAGTGDFLKTMKDAQWEVSGVEVNAEARKKANEKGIELLENLNALENKKFDIVTLWHVLEHLPDIENTIQKIQNLVRKDGLLIIAVPNFKSYDAAYYKENWAAYDVPRHLWHFSQESMKILFSTMTHIATKPMIFDSFYVSLLSEKYKTGKKFSLKGFWIGLRSNSKAKYTKEYSSLIYLFKKP